MLFFFSVLILISFLAFFFCKRFFYFVFILSFFLLIPYLLISYFDFYSFFLRLNDNLLLLKGLMFFSFGSLSPDYLAVLLKNYLCFVLFVAFATFSFAKILSIVFIWFPVLYVFHFCVDFVFILLVDFYFQSYMLFSVLEFLFSPLFLGFLLQDFRLFFFIYFFFMFFLIFSYNILFYVFTFFLLFVFSFFLSYLFSYIFSSRFFEIGSFLRDYSSLENDDIWVTSKLMDWDLRLESFNIGNTEILPSERDVYYTLLRLFFALPSNNKDFSEISSALALKYFTDDYWFVYNKSVLSLPLKKFFQSRGLFKKRKRKSQRVLLGSRFKVEKTGGLKDKLQHKIKRFKKISKFTGKKLENIFFFTNNIGNQFEQKRKFKRTTASVKYVSRNIEQKFIVREFYGSVPLKLIAKKKKSVFFGNNSYFYNNFLHFRRKLRDLSVSSNQLEIGLHAKNLRWVKFLWTTLMFISNQGRFDIYLFRFYYHINLLVRNLTRSRHYFKFCRLFGVKNPVVLELNWFEKRYSRAYYPKILDLHRVAEYFFVVITSSDEFIDNFDHLLQLQKIRNFFGDAIFEDLISVKDHVQPPKVSVRLSSDGGFRFISRNYSYSTDTGLRHYRYDPKMLVRELIFSYKIYTSRL